MVKSSTQLDAVYEDINLFMSDNNRLQETLKFARRMRKLSPFNSALVQIQRPGAYFVATRSHWATEFNRSLLPNATPITILVPFGPVDFVYDISDTEGDPVPNQVLNPFTLTDRISQDALNTIIQRVKRPTLTVSSAAMGSQLAAQIARVGTVEVSTKAGKKEQVIYHITYNSSHNPTTVFASLIQELAHLYCGRLGASDIDPEIPSRQSVSHSIKEYEAELTTLLVLDRMGIDSQLSARYLASHALPGGHPPKNTNIALVFKTIRTIEEVFGGTDVLRRLTQIDTQRSRDYLLPPPSEEIIRHWPTSPPRAEAEPTLFKGLLQPAQEIYS